MHVVKIATKLIIDKAKTHSKNSSVAALDIKGFVIFGCTIAGFQQSGVDHRGEHSVHGSSGLNDVKK